MTEETHGLGDAPIEPAYRRKMNALAHALDDMFNEGEQPKRVGFVLMVFPFENHEGRCNYISNAERADIVTLLKEQLRRFEGAPDVKGTA